MTGRCPFWSAVVLVATIMNDSGGSRNPEKRGLDPGLRRDDGQSSLGMTSCENQTAQGLGKKSRGLNLDDLGV